MESNTNALNNLSINSDAHNGNNNKYRQTNNAIIGGAVGSNSGTDASRMLEAALQHMDGIIAGNIVKFSPIYPTQHATHIGASESRK